MTPHVFTAKWRNVELKERSASQAHFIDLCRLLGVVDPITADPKGEWFTFEKGDGKTSGGPGIDTPQALILRREPTADVERYDSPRAQIAGGRHAS